MSKFLKSVTDRYRPRTDLERVFCERIAGAMEQGDHEALKQERRTLVFLREGPPLPASANEARKLRKAAEKHRYVTMNLSEGIARDAEGKMLTASTVRGAFDAALTRARNIFGRGSSKDNR